MQPKPFGAARDLQEKQKGNFSAGAIGKKLQSVWLLGFHLLDTKEALRRGNLRYGENVNIYPIKYEYMVFATFISMSF